MGKASRDKGKRGERELAKLLQERGYDAHRGQQYCGANGDADVIGVPGLHIEAKRTERLTAYPFLDQAIADAREDELPVVAHRPNGKQWIAILNFELFMDLFEMAQAACSEGCARWDKKENYL